MFAIIETGGKQVKVEEGQEIFVEKLDVNEGDSFTQVEMQLKLVCQQLKVLQLLLQYKNKVAVKKSLYSHTNVVKTQNVKKVIVNLTLN